MVGKGGLFLNNPKVDMPNLVTYLNQMPIFEWFGVVLEWISKKHLFTRLMIVLPPFQK